ncbi:uncharacterized protein LOC116290553 [Actinia tenebrosa]|uniref:Uncharacterized protein LOC116290553 n=1 Tax=Actinia tenebrosa TaxID=6105 RepID=A0A6P8HLI1_ACTTE|nr:uncharacterized protein LOC116290553 [Actinia tenebrosa]
MMNLRQQCSTYGGQKPPAVQTGMGSSYSYDIPKEMLESFIEEGFSIAEIALMFSVSESTIYHRMRSYNLSTLNVSDISDDELDVHMVNIANGFPRCGETIVKDDLHIAALHHVFKPEINRRMEVWRSA